MKRPNPKPPSDLSLALTAARDAVGDAAAVQRVHAGLLTKIAAGAAPPAAASGAGEASPASVSAAGAWLGKSLGALLLAAGAGAAAYNHYADVSPPTAASALQRSTPLAAASARQQHAPPPAPGTPQGSPPTAASAQGPTQPPVRAPQVAPVFAEAPEAPSKPPRARPARAAAPRANPAIKHDSAPPPTAAATPAACSDAVAEVELVSRAQQALRSQPQLALMLLTEHAQHFTCGVLALERDSLRIDAERALGLDAQANEHARELVARYPESPETRALKQRLDAANSGSDHKTQPVGTPTP